MPQPVLVYTRMAANKRNTRLRHVLFLLALLPVVLAIRVMLITRDARRFSVQPSADRLRV